MIFRKLPANDQFYNSFYIIKNFSSRFPSLISITFFLYFGSLFGFFIHLSINYLFVLNNLFKIHRIYSKDKLFCLRSNEISNFLLIKISVVFLNLRLKTKKLSSMNSENDLLVSNRKFIGFLFVRGTSIGKR